MDKKELKQITTKVYEEYGFVKKGKYYYLDLKDVIICSGFSSRYGGIYLMYNISIKALHSISEIKLDNIFDGYDSGGNAICFEEKKYIINYLDYNCCQYEDELKKVLYKHFEPYKLDALNYLRRMEFSQEGIPLKISAKEFLRKLPRSQSTIKGRFSD